MPVSRPLDASTAGDCDVELSPPAGGEDAQLDDIGASSGVAGSGTFPEDSCPLGAVDRGCEEPFLSVPPSAARAKDDESFDLSVSRRASETATTLVEEELAE